MHLIGPSSGIFPSLEVTPYQYIIYLFRVPLLFLSYPGWHCDDGHLGPLSHTLLPQKGGSTPVSSQRTQRPPWIGEIGRWLGDSMTLKRPWVASQGSMCGKQSANMAVKIVTFVIIASAKLILPFHHSFLLVNLIQSHSLSGWLWDNELSQVIGPRVHP